MVESSKPLNTNLVYFDGEDVEDEFNCSICWNLMCQPVTAPCGHTFCKHCLQSSLKRKRECIMCRAPIFQNVCVSTLPVNVMLQGIIEKRYPKTSQRIREIQEKQRKEEEKQQINAI